MCDITEKQRDVERLHIKTEESRNIVTVSKYYLAGRNRGIKPDPVYENRNGVIYRNGVKVGYTPVVEPFARDKRAKNEKK